MLAWLHVVCFFLSFCFLFFLFFTFRAWLQVVGLPQTLLSRSKDVRSSTKVEKESRHKFTSPKVPSLSYLFFKSVAQPPDTRKKRNCSRGGKIVCKMESSEEEDDFPSIERIIPQSNVDSLYQSHTEKVYSSSLFSFLTPTSVFCESDSVANC